jgi:hypothetical protein
MGKNGKAVICVSTREATLKKASAGAKKKGEKFKNRLLRKARRNQDCRCGHRRFTRN